MKDARPEMADMRTLVIVGTSQTRIIERQGAAPLSIPQGPLSHEAATPSPL